MSVDDGVGEQLIHLQVFQEAWRTCLEESLRLSLGTEFWGFYCVH